MGPVRLVSGAPVSRLEARGLVKCYGECEVLAGVDLRVDPGQAALLSGPTGCGKSTLLRCLAGLLRPSAGHALVSGLPARDPSARRWLGYLPQRLKLPPGLSAGEWLNLGGRLAGEGRDAVAAVAERVGITALLDRPGRALSEGQLQLIGLASALVGSPRGLLLDEPVAGLDADRAQRVVSLLPAEGDQVGGLLVASHR